MSVADQATCSGRAVPEGRSVYRSSDEHSQVCLDCVSKYGSALYGANDVRLFGRIHCRIR